MWSASPEGRGGETASPPFRPVKRPSPRPGEPGLYFRCLFAILTKVKLRRIAQLRIPDPVAQGWVTRLLDKRRHLVAVIQGLARHLHHQVLAYAPSFGAVAGLAEQLDVALRAAATVSNRNDVIKL